MIVDYAPSKGLSLLEADDFKGFKLCLAGDEARPAISGVSFVDDANVLIGVDLVPTLPGAPGTGEWLAGYRAMVDYAAKKGWIDAANNSIRAHVERVP
ncbi:MAG: hypothetical protein ABIK36_10545 [Pseudomonadota bacterium]